MLQNLTKERVKLSTVEMKSHPQLLISDNFYKQAEFLCKHIPTVEWSGIVIYKVTGSMSCLFEDKEEVNKEDFFIEVLDIIPMDKGTAASTDYKFGPEVQKYMKNLADERGIKPADLYKLRLAHCHNHVNMSTGFSSTDNEELEDNVFNHNGYLSIITNNRKEYNAKFVVGCIINRKMEGNFNDVDGKNIPILREEEPKSTMLVFTPKIIFENQDITFDKTFLEALENIKKVPEGVLPVNGFNRELYKYHSGGNYVWDYATGRYEEKVLSTEIENHHNVQVLGNLKQSTLNKISTTEAAFLNFIKDALVNSFTEYKNTITALNYSLTKILFDINKYYQTHSTVDKETFKQDLIIYLPISYENYVKEVVNEKDTYIYLNDLKQAISIINSESNRKSYPTATRMIEGVCNKLIQETKQELNSVTQ
jgi:hypothetical protein